MPAALAITYNGTTAWVGPFTTTRSLRNRQFEFATFSDDITVTEHAADDQPTSGVQAAIEILDISPQIFNAHLATAKQAVAPALRAGSALYQ